MKLIVYIFFALLALGCTTTKVVQVPVESVRTEIERVRDSIIIRDSVDRWHKGDTLVVYRWRTEHHYHHDTIRSNDTIPVVQTVEVVKEVNHLYWWQKALMWLGVAGIVVLIIKIKL